MVAFEKRQGTVLDRSDVLGVDSRRDAKNRLRDGFPCLQMREGLKDSVEIIVRCHPE